jgi:hypothetical protein
MKTFVSCLALIELMILGMGEGIAQSQKCADLTKLALTQLASVKETKKENQIRLLLREAELAKAVGDTVTCKASASKAIKAIKAAKK